jgi:penicillin-binding protein 2
MTVIVCIMTASGILVRAGLSHADQQAFNELSGNIGTPDVAPTPTTEPTPTPPPTPTAIVTEDPASTASTWFALADASDFSGMYGLLSPNAQKLVTRDDFVQRYTDVYTEAGITGITGELTGEMGEDGRLPFRQTVESGLFPAITEDHEFQLVQQDGRWLVDWSPSLIFNQLGDTGCIDFRPETTARGRILDRNGNVLAEDIDVLRIGVVPGEITDPAATYGGLEEIVDIPAADIQAKVEREAGDPSWFIPIKDVSSDNATTTINALENLSGVAARRATSRSYPYADIAAHVTGWVTRATQEDVAADTTGSIQLDQLVGQAGVEYGANAILAGKPGGDLLVVDCGTRAERDVITESEGTPPQDVQLTIDIDLQTEVDKDMAALQGEERGAAVILDPRTGAVLAMVSRPSFDPNAMLNGSFDEQERARLDDPDLRPLANRATLERYPTGSIFKVITASAAMADLGMTGESEIDCPQSFQIGNSIWNDWVVENDLSAQGMLTLHSAIVQSCNTVFYQLGAELDDKDPELLPNMAKAYGLGAKTGIPYFPETEGTVPDPEWKREVIDDGWATGDAVQLSIGQGYLTATPLQMANAYSAIANGGTLLQPYIVDRSIEPASGTETQLGERTVIRELPLTDAQLDDLHSALRDQTSAEANVGSARIFRDMTWPIAGKTGTAQNGDPEVDKPHSWFAAYGPGDEGDTATITSCVMIENVGEGVAYAAPVTRKIYDWYLQSDLNDSEPSDSGDATDG